MEAQNRPISFKKFLPGIAWFLFVMVLLCMPGDDVPDEGDWLIPHFDKLVHAGLFGGIVFWFCMPFKKAILPPGEKIHFFIRISLASIVWGITTEYIQKFFVQGRDFDLMDWAADSAGVIMAFFVCRKFFL